VAAAAATTATATKARRRLPTVLAIAALIVSAAAVAIFAGLKTGALDGAGPSPETGPPSSAAPPHRAGDTLDRPDAVAEAKARALVARFQAGATGDPDDLAVDALIAAARRARTRSEAEVYLVLALELNPSEATAERLRNALEAVVALRPGTVSSDALGGDFLLDDSARDVALEFTGPEAEFSGGVADAARDGARTTADEGAPGLRTDDAAISSTSGTEGSGTGTTPNDGSTVVDFGSGTNTASTAGPVPIPLPVPTAASNAE